MQNKVLRIIIIVMLCISCISIVINEYHSNFINHISTTIQNHIIKNPSVINACINKLSYCNDYFQTWVITDGLFLSYFTMHFQ